MRLIMLPFAGGYAQSYRPLCNAAPDQLECICPELAGRGRRFSDPAITDINDMCADLTNQVGPYLDKPYALFGHSMGALLAWLVAHRLRSLGAPNPRALIVSGLEGPSVLERPIKRHLLPKEEFRCFLDELGGCQAGVLEDPELFDLFEPALRADFQALESFHYAATKPLDLPLLMLRGKEDTVSREQAMAWRQEIRGEFELIDFEGEHFFIFQHAPGIMELISSKLEHMRQR